MKQRWKRARALMMVLAALVLAIGCEDMGGGVRGADLNTHGVPLALTGHTIVLTVLNDECAPVIPGMDTLGFAFVEDHVVEALLIVDGQIAQRAVLDGWGWEWTPTSQWTAELLLVFDNTVGGPPGSEIMTTTHFRLSFNPDAPTTGTWIGESTSHRGPGADCSGEANGTFSITPGIGRQKR